MIKSITAINQAGDSIKMELRFPEKSGFLILDIDGISPTKGTINTTEILSGNGSSFNSARVNSRNIVLKLQLLEKPTIEESRLLLYKYFPVTGKVTLQIETEERISEIIGYVESHEVNLFTKKETAVISVLCPYPFFRSINKDVLSFSEKVPLFQFPFSNESLVNKLLEMSILTGLYNKIISYSGDFPSGILMTIQATEYISNLRIINVITSESMELLSSRIIAILGSDISIGDEIIISTYVGEKYVFLKRNGVVYNIRNALGRSTDWFQLQNGDNVFAFLSDSGVPGIDVRIENYILYQGV